MPPDCSRNFPQGPVDPLTSNPFRTRRTFHECPPRSPRSIPPPANTLPSAAAIARAITARAHITRNQRIARAGATVNSSAGRPVVNAASPTTARLPPASTVPPPSPASTGHTAAPTGSGTAAPPPAPGPSATCPPAQRIRASPQPSSAARPRSASAGPHRKRQPRPSRNVTTPAYPDQRRRRRIPDTRAPPIRIRGVNTCGMNTSIGRPGVCRSPPENSILQAPAANPRTVR